MTRMRSASTYHYAWARASEDSEVKQAGCARSTYAVHSFSGLLLLSSMEMASHVGVWNYSGSVRAFLRRARKTGPRGGVRFLSKCRADAATDCCVPAVFSTHHSARSQRGTPRTVVCRVGLEDQPAGTVISSLVFVHMVKRGFLRALSLGRRTNLLSIVCRDN